MKVAQKNSTNTNTVSVALPHPPNIPNIEPPPLRTVCPMICPVSLKYPDEFIPNMKLSQNSSTSPDTPLSRVSNVHDTSDMIPPLRTPCPTPCPVITPEPVFHPRMNFRSEHRASY